MKIIEEKEKKLKKILKEAGSAVIGFSGGCDSAFLLYMAAQAGIKTLAVTFHSQTFPSSHLKRAEETAAALNISHRVINFDHLSIPSLKNNPPNRCYICKKNLFGKLIETAREEKYKTVMDGGNADDAKDFRPGRKALKELGVASPLEKAGFTKAEIRKLLQKAGLPQWNAPSFACYFSRFPYHMEIDEAALQKTAASEEGLHKLGFLSARVRCHGDLARIETDEKDFAAMTENRDIRRQITEIVKSAGFIFVSIDTEGYRTGSMNATRGS